MPRSWTAPAFAACLALGACAQQNDVLAPPASASKSSFGEMPEGPLVEAPRGYRAMCERDASLCARVQTDASRAGAAIDADPAAAFTLLDRINRRVNGAARQMSDKDAWGRDEYWTPAGEGFGAKGDCEDIAIEKRLELQRAGFPSDRLFYAVAFRHGLGLHIVLVARTKAGDVVLDSRTPYLTPWEAAPYVWISRQSDDNPGAWRVVEAARAVTLAVKDVAGRPGA